MIVPVGGYVNKSKMEKFKKCFRCQGTNTRRMFLGTTEESVVYIGWCDTCNREYSHRERIVDVLDKEERI